MTGPSMHEAVVWAAALPRKVLSSPQPMIKPGDNETLITDYPLSRYRFCFRCILVVYMADVAGLPT